MKGFILILFSLSSFLFSMALLQLFFLSRSRIEKRVQYYLMSPSEEPLPKKKIDFLVEIKLLNHKIKNQLPSIGYNKKLEQLLSRSGVAMTIEEFIVFQWICTVFMAMLLYLISKNVFFLMLGGFIGYITPKGFLKRKQFQRILKFNEGLADMITIIVGSLRAGFSFPQALKSVVEEASSPIKEEVDLVLKEMQYGSHLDEALYHLQERMPSNDLELMIQAILIQKQVGGNLATVLDTIVETIRDRNAVQRQIFTLTAQGRLSGMVIGLLPIVLGLSLYLVNPSYIDVLFTHPIGIRLITSGGAMGIVGFILIRKLTTIEV